jgi:hypothetical protein
MLIYLSFGVLSVILLFYRPTLLAHRKWLEDIRHCDDRIKRTPTNSREWFQRGYNLGRLDILISQATRFQSIILAILRCFNIGNHQPAPTDDAICKREATNHLYKIEHMQYTGQNDMNTSTVLAGRYLGIYSERNDPKNGKQFFKHFADDIEKGLWDSALQKAQQLT